jgi:nickel-dependent lactate racemase
MMYSFRVGVDHELTDEDLRVELGKAFDQMGRKAKVLALPPDITRKHSLAGLLTRFSWEYWGKALKDIMPAVGTHACMTGGEIEAMFPGVPPGLFRNHNWRTDVVTRGYLPKSVIEELSEGKLSYEWPAQLNKSVASGGHDLILSIGQVVPHEVVGMANYTKNLLVGIGGAGAIDGSHYLGAVYGMERIMGEIDTPVRRLYNAAAGEFLADLPIVYVLTVIARDSKGGLACRGISIGDDSECFNRAAELARRVNIAWMDEPLEKAVVYLDPEE